ncbi:MAG: glycosyltransferase [Rhodospirillaceae bacterium]
MTDGTLPRLCLVTTNFNYGAYLDDCIRSVVSSRGFDRVDYVVMDGGSDDDSVDTIKKYASQLKHWQSEKDEGMYHAIQAGFALSDAPYMGWLNSDDQLAPWAIQTVLDIFDHLPDVKWITSRFPMQARKDGVVVRTSILPGVDNWGFFNGEHVRTLGLPSTGWIVQDCTFWRRDLWEDAGACFDHSLKLAGDFELWARFMMRTDL